MNFGGAVATKLVISLLQCSSVYDCDCEPEERMTWVSETVAFPERNVVSRSTNFVYKRDQ